MIQRAQKYYSIYKHIEDSFIEIPNNSAFYNISGIYMIKNIITDEVYIGQSKSIGYRLTSHRSMLRANKHIYKNNKYDILQKSGNKYGENSFQFYAVEICTIDKLDERETYGIKYFNCNRLKSGSGFNLTDGGNKPPQGKTKGYIKIKDPTGTKGKAVPPDVLENYLVLGGTYGIANKEIVGKKISETAKSQHRVSPMKNKKCPKEGHQKAIGRKQSLETINKRREKLINKLWIYLCNEEKIPIEKRVLKDELDTYLSAGGKIGRTPYIRRKPKEQCHYRKGPLSRESIEKSAKAKEKPILQLDLNNNIIAEYMCIKETIEKTGIKKSIIYRMILNKIKKLDKYNYRFVYKKKYKEGE